MYITAECLRQTSDDQDADGFRDCLYDITWSGAIGNNYSFDENGEVVGLSSRVLKNYWGRSTSCLRERQAYYSRLICLLTCMNGTSWPDIVGVGRQFTGQFHKDPPLSAAC